ncbi:MAG TPA: hypothetical protein VK559_07770 [Ferruginibacter sp.]|nr:hypothetical protein [Ferruginibacter sp.]
MGAEFTIEKIIKKDLPEISALALNNGGNQRLTETYIENWYLNNPSNSVSLCKVVNNKGAIEGYATTNNFMFTIEGKPSLVAMPQNVLTSLKVRGKGLFNKLYFKTESDNLEENKVDCFLTFTNKLSTPIFLNKFAYEKGLCPAILFTPFNFFDLLSSYQFKRLTAIDQMVFSSIYSFDNAIQKDEAYFKWRYKLYTAKELHLVEIKEKSIIIGYAFLKATQKKGIPYLFLMDIIAEKKDNIAVVIEACFTYSSKQFFSGVVMFDGAFDIKKRTARIRLQNRLNFLVKGKTPALTAHLSQVNFNFFFGDLDIV